MADPKRVAAGRKGGQANRDAHADDPDYFARIGRVGGAKGGRTTLDRHGVEHFQRIGRIRRANQAAREETA